MTGREQASQKNSPREEELGPEPTGGAVGTVAVAWLPAGDYEQAVTLWPDFAGSDRVAGPDGPLPHAQYCRVMQQQFVEFADAGMPGLVIAPVQVAPFAAWCAEQSQQPDSADARAEYAAHLAATADPCLIAWPPERNQPCWCGSGRKYKKCCAAPTSVDVDPRP
jgi:hypothetical protein